MRAPASVLRWLSAGILAVGVVLGASIPARADTGTYRVADYSITLEPQSSGQVKMIYQQTWEVLSGNIPWITVGLPNANFTILQSGGASQRVAADNGGGFTGVRIDLDRAYLPGESFSVSFTVLQSNLLERLTEDKRWRIVFTPGWYDRAPIDHLQITLSAPVGLTSYPVMQPLPSGTTNANASSTMTWTWSNLPAGSRVSMHVECLDGNFLSPTVPIGPQKSFPWGTVAIAVIVIAVVGFIVFAVRRARQARDEQLKAQIAATEQQMAEDPAKKAEIEKGFREYVVTEDMQPDEQGRYYDRGYGDYITPAIWAAVIMGQHMHDTRTCVASACVACACVSCACACACACAGGGAAGCARKTLHECRECLKRGAAPSHDLTP